MDPSLTTIPGYHMFLAIMGLIAGESSTSFLRFMTALIGIGGLFLAFKIASRLTPDRAELRMSQLLFLPIIFVFFPLLYTDIPSLVIILAALHFFLRRRYEYSFAVAAVSILVRQNNIVWFLLFVVLWTLIEGTTTVEYADRTPQENIRDRIRRYIRTFRMPNGVRMHTAIIAITCISFAIFVWSNGGVAIGDQGAHPFPSVHVGNIFFLLMLFTTLLLPMVLWQIPAMLRAMRDRPWVVPMLVALFIIYMFTFSNSHGYNQGIDSVFLRNRILTLITLNPLLKATAWIPVGLAVLSLIVTPLRKHWWLLYPFTIIYLLPSWLIEQRYYIIPFALFLLVRKEQSLSMERLLLLYQVLLSGILFWGVAQRWYFI